MQMESMEWTCQHCGGTGKVKHPTSKIEESMLIVCSHCSTPSAYAWCGKCGMGTEVAGINFPNFQRSWKCVECGSTYNLSKDFYEKQIAFAPKKFVDVKQLELERDIRNQKHLPVWVKTADKFFEGKRKYFMRAMVATLMFFIITFGSTIIFNEFGGCHLNDSPMSICSMTFFVSLGLLALLGSMLFLHALAGMLWRIVNIVSLVTYKLKWFRE